MEKPTPRSIALSLGEQFYFTGLPCVRNHICKRFSSDGNCFECKKIKGKVYALERRSNPDKAEKHKLATKIWKEKNKEHLKEYARQYQLKCVGVFSLKWRQKNLDRVKAYATKYNKENRHERTILENHRRAKKAHAGGKYTLLDVAEIRRLQKDACAYCKEKLFGKGHIDHIMPLAKGGSNHRSNLQLTCQSCNCRKHAKHPIKFAQEMGFLL